MDREQARPLTLPEAKARLIEAAERASLARWTKDHPWEAVATAFSAGFVTGATPDAGRKARGLAGFLIETILKSR